MGLSGSGQGVCKSAYAMDRRPKIPSNHNRISFSLSPTIFGNPATTKTLTPTATVMSNGGDCRYEIAQNAYIKLVLHALKHKTSAVNGVLLGRLSGDVVEITESVPLFHSSQIGLLPSLEIALIMVFSLILIFRFFVFLFYDQFVYWVV